MRRLISVLTMFVCLFGIAHAQQWTTPELPAEDVNSLSSSTIVYMYNVEADAFVMYGMASNNEACAARLTNGDKTATIPNQSYVYVADGKLKVRNKERGGSNYISCTSASANSVVINKTTNADFAYTETVAGSHVYTLCNTAFGKDLDVSWTNGGHLTLASGAGKTKWAFIKESNVTNGAYALYKSKKQLYDVYKAVADAGKADTYAAVLADAYTAYTDTKATMESITNAARVLFRSVCADITEPLNVSFMLDNADMVGSASAAGWTSDSPAFGWEEFEVYHKAFTLEQDNVLPLGTYDLGFRSLYREDGSGTAPTLTVTTAKGKYTGKTPLMSTIDYGVANATDNNWTTVNGRIQPNGMQSCGQALAHGSAMAWANNIVVDAEGAVNIKYVVSSGNQWVNWQGFELIYKGLSRDDLVANLKATIDEATALYGDGTGNGADALKVAIDNANTIYADASATNTVIKNTIDALVLAMKTYRYGNASLENPIDMTSMIVNPSFEKQKEGWNITDMATQGNTVFTLKKGSLYLEKWTGKGGHVGNGSALQILKGLDLGIYKLVAAAQNIQEDSPTASQTGAWIVASGAKTAVDKRAEYELTFTNIEDEVTIGFQAVSATGNWMAVDNFRLYYVGGTFADYKTALNDYLDKALAVADKKMHTAAKQELDELIAAVQAELQKSDANGYKKVSTALRKATEETERSIDAYAQLLAAIEKAESQYGDGTFAGAETYLKAINAAKDAYADGTTSYEKLAEQILLLDEAAFAYMINNPSGAVPVITKTDNRYARGSVMAFGRFTYNLNGAKLREVGFCYSTTKNPTVLDQRSTRYIDSNGRIYIMDNMKPATVYYARPYVVSEGYQVAYGDELKIITIPKASIGWSWNNGGSAEENERIREAMRHGIEDIWGNLMSTQGFHLTGNYGSGTPTADCSYGGWMRVGPNASYQRTGTILHEAAHGVGVGTHWTWGTLLVNGSWTGPRANSVLQFWENNTTSTMAGDAQHMWPYGINGAHEDNGSDALYMIQALIIQGMHEDGLSPTGGTFALPAYTFEHDDDVKYYIKNENQSFGLNTSYLTISGSTLKWQEATSAEITSNDAYAWYLSFDPQTQYYSLRNAATRQYITYNGSTFTTASATTPTASEKFQVMKGRKTVKVGSGTSAMNVLGYWILKANGSSATAMAAAASGKVTAAGFDLSADASAQHWVILTAEETEAFDNAARFSELNELKSLITNVTAMVATPHTEDVAEADATINTVLASAAVVAEDANATLEAINDAVKSLRQAVMDFMVSVTPSNAAEPFDISFLMADPSITTSEGWSISKTVQSSGIEFYEQSFDFNQTVKGLPKGTYKLMVQGFNRPGETAAVYADYHNGKNNAAAFFYAGSSSLKMCHLAQGASTSKVHSDDLTMSSPFGYVPCTIASAAAYFKQGYYENTNVFALTKTTDLKIGVRQGTVVSLTWTFFDNFRMYYYGSISKDIVTEIDGVNVSGDNVNCTSAVYNLHGQKVGTSLEGLPKGIYIVNKKKVFVE